MNIIKISRDTSYYTLALSRYSLGKAENNHEISLDRKFNYLNKKLSRNYTTMYPSLSAVFSEVGLSVRSQKFLN